MMHVPNITSQPIYPEDSGHSRESRYHGVNRYLHQVFYDEYPVDPSRSPSPTSQVFSVSLGDDGGLVQRRFSRNVVAYVPSLSQSVDLSLSDNYMHASEELAYAYHAVTRTSNVPRSRPTSQVTPSSSDDLTNSQEMRAEIYLHRRRNTSENYNIQGSLSESLSALVVLSDVDPGIASGRFMTQAERASARARIDELVTQSAEYVRTLQPEVLSDITDMGDAGASEWVMVDHRHESTVASSTDLPSTRRSTRVNYGPDPTIPQTTVFMRHRHSMSTQALNTLPKFPLTPIRKGLALLKRIREPSPSSEQSRRRSRPWWHVGMRRKPTESPPPTQQQRQRPISTDHNFAHFDMLTDSE
ncbi:hypothetical protein BDF19DRAFT_445864 [Syncephalis fuscata]|nr:hypothetical protein BDF19DRAFT_445864 [Syncephalis fuscata]